MDKTFLLNSVWNLVSTVFARGSVFAVNIIIARLIEPELFGRYTYIKTTAQLFELSLGLAFGLSMTKFIASSFDDKKKSFDSSTVIKTNLFASLVLSLIVFIVLELCAGKIMSNPSVEDISLLRVAFVYLLFSNLNHCFIGVIKGVEKFKLLMKMTSFLSVIGLLISFVLTYLSGLTGAVYSLVIISFVQFVFYLFVVNKEFELFKVIIDANIHLNFKLISKFNIPTLISGLSGPPTIWFINYMLSNSKGGYNELALFNVAYLIFAIIVFIPLSLSDTIFPRLNKHAGGKMEFVKIFKRNFVLMLVVSVSISVVVLLGGELILSLFGKEYNRGASALNYLCFAAVFSSLLTYLGKVLATYSKMWMNLWFNMLWCVLVLIIPMISKEVNSQLISVSFLYAYIAVFILQFIYVLKLLRNHENYISR